MPRIYECTNCSAHWLEDQLEWHIEIDDTKYAVCPFDLGGCSNSSFYKKSGISKEMVDKLRGQYHYSQCLKERGWVYDPNYEEM